MEKGILLIENPEAHLHPLAQSRLMRLICKRLIECPHLQIFIETHSEHIINGARLCALKDDADLKAFTNKDISIYFFDKDFSVKQLEVKKNGRIPNWPEGFFDQQTKDLNEIITLGIRKA